MINDIVAKPHSIDGFKKIPIMFCVITALAVSPIVGCSIVA
jgi:hypothetical protein